jgi:hypothetical protein
MTLSDLAQPERIEMIKGAAIVTAAWVTKAGLRPARPRTHKHNHNHTEGCCRRHRHRH